MMTLSHDTKLRTMCAAATAAALCARFGEDDGAVAAALDAGPVDQADRTSAQNKAAKDNLDGTEQDATARDMLTLASQGKVDASQLGA